LLAGPGIFWQNTYYQSLNSFGGGQSDVPRSFVPGSVAAQDWNVYPLHTPLNSNVPVSLPNSISPFFGVPLSATRTGNDLGLDVNPFTDDTTGHTGTGFAQGLFASIGSISGSYEIDDNGKKLSAGTITPTILFGSFTDLVTLPTAPSTVAFTLRARRSGPLFPLSTAVADTWSWQSASGPSVAVPSGWYCTDGSQKCAIQPLLTFGYQVAHIAVDGTAPAGAQEVRINVGHQALLPSPPAVTGLTAQYSLNGGTTWQQASVTGSGGTWYASYDAPSGSYVSLRVAAADAAGGALTETLTRAYATQTEVPGAAAHRAPAVPVLDASLAKASGPDSGSASGYRPACAPVGPGQARCFVLFAPEPLSSANTASANTASAAAKPTTPLGWGPRDIEHAYKLPIGRDSHATVAVVEAYDTPRLESYLNTYRRQYGLKPCTVSNGCFRKVGQNGSAKHLPSSGVLSGWDLEATLDVDMVSAACPTCRILVVEANGQDFGQLAAAEDTAVRLGAVVVSNSYGTRETGQVQAYAKAYDHPGRTIVVSSGDFGYTAASFPANLTSVTAVGGTELFRAKNKRGWRETAWNSPGLGAGASGCSAYVAKPSWQRDKHCQGRTVADVSAVALNLAIYNKDWGGWGLVGGTSASSPLVAGIYALAGNATKIKPGAEYAHVKSLFDVTSGNNDWFFGQNGASCGNDYLCVAKKGYDAPTGLGTPDGIGAF
jgi:Subtilase family